MLNNLFIAVRSIIPVAILAALAPSSAQAEDMGFRMIYANHSNFIVAEGEITADTPRVFKAFLNSNPFDGFNFEIHFNSPGGNLVGGMRLGAMIRELGLKADVAAYDEDSSGPGMCMSACALAFLGGEPRTLTGGSRLGFHQFSSSGQNEGRVVRLQQAETDTQMMAGLVQQYILSMGISGELFTIMSVTPPERMYIPNSKEMDQFGILSVEAFRGFSLEPWQNGIRAFAVFENNARGRDIVSRVDFLCISEQPLIVLSQPDSFAPLTSKWVRMIGNVGYSIEDRFRDETIQYSPENIRFLTSGKEVAVLLADQRGVEALLSPHSYIYVKIAGAFGNNMSLELRPTDADRQVIRTAFRLCS
jgi:hypothetical protein